MSTLSSRANMCSKQHCQSWLLCKCRRCTCLLKVSVVHEWLPLIFKDLHWASLLHQNESHQHDLQGGRGQRQQFLQEQAGSAIMSSACHARQHAILLNGLHTPWSHTVNLQAASHTPWTEAEWTAYQQVLEGGKGLQGRQADLQSNSESCHQSGLQHQQQAACSHFEIPGTSERTAGARYQLMRAQDQQQLSGPWSQT